MSIYEIEVPTIDGGLTTLEEFKGQLLLIVNTASGCGLAPQFEGLEKLYLDFKEKGFSVLGFPCNQFAGQEPLTAEQAAAHCQLTYNTTWYTPSSRRALSMPLPVVALPCGSRSMTRTRLPLEASDAARLTVLVVLPTPPFWLATARICALMFLLLSDR